MAGPAALFRDIHRLRRFARDLQEQIERVPRQLKAQETRVSRQQDLLRQTQEAIRHLKVAAHEKEVSLKSKHGQVARHEQQLQGAGSTKEYNALQAEIAAGKEACLRLEDEILACMAESEEKSAQVPELEKALRQAREEFAAFEKEASARRAGLQEQLNDTLKQLAQAEEQIPPNIRPQYNRIVAAMGADALAAVRERTCSACHTGITAQNHNDLLQEHFVICASCGRIIYLPEG